MVISNLAAKADEAKLFSLEVEKTLRQFNIEVPQDELQADITRLYTETNPNDPQGYEKHWNSILKKYNINRNPSALQALRSLEEHYLRAPLPVNDGKGTDIQERRDNKQSERKEEQHSTHPLHIVEEKNIFQQEAREGAAVDENKKPVEKITIRTIDNTPYREHPGNAIKESPYEEPEAPSNTFSPPPLVPNAPQNVSYPNSSQGGGSNSLPNTSRLRKMIGKNIKKKLGKSLTRQALEQGAGAAVRSTLAATSEFWGPVVLAILGVLAAIAMCIVLVIAFIQIFNLLQIPDRVIISCNQPLDGSEKTADDVITKINNQFARGYKLSIDTNTLIDNDKATSKDPKKDMASYNLDYNQVMADNLQIATLAYNSFCILENKQFKDLLDPEESKFIMNIANIPASIPKDITNPSCHVYGNSTYTDKQGDNLANITIFNLDDRHCGDIQGEQFVIAQQLARIVAVGWLSPTSDVGKKNRASLTPIVLNNLLSTPDCAGISVTTDANGNKNISQDPLGKNDGLMTCFSDAIAELVIASTNKPAPNNIINATQAIAANLHTSCWTPGGKEDNELYDQLYPVSFNLGTYTVRPRPGSGSDNCGNGRHLIDYPREVCTDLVIDSYNATLDPNIYSNPSKSTGLGMNENKHAIGCIGHSDGMITFWRNNASKGYVLYDFYNTGNDTDKKALQNVQPGFAIFFTGGSICSSDVHSITGKQFAHVGIVKDIKIDANGNGILNTYEANANPKTGSYTVNNWHFNLGPDWGVGAFGGFTGQVKTPTS